MESTPSVLHLTKSIVKEASSEFFKKIKTVVVVVLLLDGIYYALYDFTSMFGILPREAADSLFALLGAFLTPLHGAIFMLLLHQWHEGGVAWPPMQLLKEALGYWTRLFVLYFAVSIIWLGWVLLGCAPVLLVMALTGVENPVFLAFGAIPAVWVCTRFALIDPLCVLRGISGARARWRSTELLQRRDRFAVLVIGFFVLAPGWLCDFFAPELLASVAYGFLRPADLGVGFGVLALQLIGSLLGAFGYFCFYRLYLRCWDASQVDT